MIRSPIRLAPLTLLLTLARAGRAQVVALAPSLPAVAAQARLAPTLGAPTALVAPAMLRTAPAIAAAPIAAAASAPRAPAPAATPAVAVADRDDLSGIMEIERTSFDRFTQWDSDAWLEAVGDPSATVKVIRVNGRVAAAIYYGPADDGSLYISSLGVHPDFRKRGYGEALMREALAAAEDDHRFASITLHVRADNAPAVALYAKLGFRVVERLPHYYEDGADGFFMSRDAARSSR